jgi:hypothetical protein
MKNKIMIKITKKLFLLTKQNKKNHFIKTKIKIQAIFRKIKTLMIKIFPLLKLTTKRMIKQK